MIRLTTDAPLSLIESEAPFVLTRPVHLVFGPDEPFQGDLSSTCREFADFMMDYLSDELSTESRAAFECHLSLSTNCRHYLASYRETVDAAALPSTIWTMQSMQRRVTSSLRPLGQTISILSTLEEEPRPKWRRRSEVEA